MQGEYQARSDDHPLNIFEDNMGDTLDFSSTDYDDLFKANSELNVKDEYNIF